jgi:hypothetical protein
MILEKKQNPKTGVPSGTPCIHDQVFRSRTHIPYLTARRFMVSSNATGITSLTGRMIKLGVCLPKLF